ncbi:hypothetical protein ADL26_19215, partial [Thermoactinomyces vulgaris]
PPPPPAAPRAPVAGDAAVHVQTREAVRAVVAVRGPRSDHRYGQTATDAAEVVCPVAAAGVQDLLVALAPLRVVARPGASWHRRTPYRLPSASSGNGGCASGRTAMRMSMS